MTKKNKNVNKIEKSEIQYYRMLVVLAALIAVIFSVTYLTDWNHEAFQLKVAPISAAVLAILSIGASVLFAIKKAHGANEEYSVFSSGYLVTISLWLTSIFAFYSISASKKLMAYVIVTAALYFIYNLFSREFFVFSLYNALGAGFLVLINSATFVSHIVFSVLVVAVSAFFVSVVLTKKAFELKLGKLSISVTDGKYKAYPFCISAGIMLAGVVLSFLYASMAFYTLIVLFVYYLIFTIVNTVKMM
ncbi:MAG: hypothetical protein IJ303_02565 [Clostridia bacterium]|nr:hypothetical protein [Clostridia bacterium]